MAECDHNVVGFVGLDVQHNEAEIDHLWVLPEFMGLGIGRRLVYCALDYCKSRGVERLKVASDPNAADFYRRMGAVQQGQVVSTPAPRSLPLLQFDVDQHATNQ